MGRQVSVLVLLGMFGALLIAPPAAAWTEAQIQRGNATIELQPDGSAHVSLELQLAIARGWLEQLELATLDEPLTLDVSRPPSFVGTEEPVEKYRPLVSVSDGGTVRLNFHGRGASPRRGRYITRLHYSTQLEARIRPTTPGSAKISWQFPAFQTSLDDVSLTVIAPTRYARYIPITDESAPDVTVRSIQSHDHTILLFRRSHIPRHTPWDISLLLPRAALSQMAIPPAAATTATASGSPAKKLSTSVSLFPLVAVLLLAACGVLYRRTLQQRGGETRGLVPLALFPRAAVTVLLGSAAAVWCVEIPAVALGCVATAAMLQVELPPALPQRVDDGRALAQWRCIARRDLKRARRQQVFEALGLAGFVDITTPLGMALVTLAIAGAGYWLKGSEIPPPVAFSCGSLSLVPLLSMTRFHLPGHPDGRLDLIRKFAAKITSSQTAWRLEVRDDPVADARLVRICPDGSEHIFGVSEEVQLGGTQKTVCPWCGDHNDQRA